MKADNRWKQLPDSFWHYVRVISESLGYSRKKVILRHDTNAIIAALKKLGLLDEMVAEIKFGNFLVEDLVEYFDFRATLIEGKIKNYLQTAAEAKVLFEKIAEEYTEDFTPQLKNGKENGRTYLLKNGSTVGVPYNKQKGEKYDVDFLTGASNILLAHYLGDEAFDPDPRRLPVFTKAGELVGSMSRRMDGAYPSCTDPVSLWEFKCYYYTTTFGSKISDAIYISDLDGFERTSVENQTGRKIHLTLFVDAYGTWMDQGKSYLCRMVDMLQRGAVDNVVVGSEIVSAIPALVSEWKAEAQKQIG